MENLFYATRKLHEFEACLPATMFGLLNIHKPTSWTSRDVVNWITQQARGVKIGHAGTLDPLATGVLVICLGHATRLVPHLHAQQKTYVATFQLGRRSDSDDIDTPVEILPNAPLITTQQLREVLPRFIGRITQLPPIYSAVKVDGSRAYRKARKGAEVEMPEREIDVHRLELLSHSEDEFTLEIDCGSGTYVRSIGRDIAIACGSYAVMSSLCRTRIGDFTVQDAIEPKSVLRRTIAGQLLSPTRALPFHQQVPMSAEQSDLVAYGCECEAAPEHGPYRKEIALIDHTGILLALAEYDSLRNKLVPKVVMRSPPSKNRDLTESVPDHPPT